MRTIINNQKKERDILLSRPYLTRHTQYDVDELSASKQIKLITGPRRTGKSTEALLMLKSRNFAYLNFDDGKLLSAWDDDLVWETLRAVYPDFEYLLLDEVQNLDGWDLWVPSFTAWESTWLLREATPNCCERCCRFRL